MAWSLYDINFQIEKLYAESCDPETGEVIDEKLFELLDKCEFEREERVLYIADRIKSQKAEASAYRNEAKKLKARAEKCENDAERDERYVEANLEDGEVIKNEHSEVSRGRRSASVLVTDASQIPDNYCRHKIEPDKVLMLMDLKADKKIPGVLLIHRRKLQIK